MAANSLVFNIFGVDRSASATIAKVGLKAEETGKKTAVAGGKVATGIAVGITALGAVSVESAVKFEKSITLLQTAAGESSKNLKTVSDGILDVSNKTGVSADDLSEGMFIVEKAMFRGSDGVKVLQAAAEGAVAEGADMGTMTTALTSILSSYHLKASDAATVTSQMDRAAGLSKTTMQNFAGSLSTVLPIASAAGLSFAQVGGAIATLTAHGTTADESTQELNATIRALQAPNMVAQKEMTQLGINVSDLTGNLGKRGLTGTLDIVVGALGKVGPGGKVLLDAFKKSGAASADMQIMMKNMTPSAKSLADELVNGGIGVGAYTKTMKTLDVQSYTQAKQFLALKVASGGFNEAIKSGSPATQSAIEALKKMMGGSIGLNTALMLTGENAAPFAERVKEIGTQAQAANGDISTFHETSGTAANQQARLAAQIHTLAITIGTGLLPFLKTLLTHLSTMVKWLKDNWSWVGKVVVVLLAMAVAFKTIGVVLKVVNGAMELFKLLMMGSGIGLIVVAIAALVAGFIYLWNTSKGFRDFWIGLWGSIKTIVSDVVGAVVTAFNAVISAITTAWSAIGTFFSGLWSSITGWLSGLWSNLTGAGSKIVTTVSDGISGAWSAIAGWFTGLWTSVTGWLANVWANLTGAGAHLISSIVSGISGAWHTVSAWFTGLWASVTAWLGDIWHLMATSVGGRLIGSIVSGIASGWHAFSAWFTGMWSSISTWIAGVWSNVTGVGARIINSISSGIRSAWHNVSAWFTGLWFSISQWVSNVAGGIYNWAAGIINSASRGISSAWHSVSGWFTNLWWSISQWVAGVAGSIYTWAAGIMTSVSNGIRSTWNSVAGWFTGLWKSITGWVGDIGTNIYNWGAGLILKLSGGIGAFWQMLSSWFTGLWNSVVGWLGSTLSDAYNWGVSFANNVLSGIGNLAQKIAAKMSPSMPVIGGGVVGDAFNASHAKGGPLLPNTFGTVGEEGIETYAVDSRGRATIYSNPSTANGLRAPASMRGLSSPGAGGGGGGLTVHVHVTGLVGGTQDGLARSIVDTINQATRRGTIPRGALA